MASRNPVADRLQALLSERELAPGERLPPERQLAAELGIARSSLREGMRRLLDLGILEARQGSGTYLATLDLDDLLETRLLLEPYAARLAAERRDERDLARLDDRVARMRATHEDPTAFAAADAELHAAIVEAARSLSLRVLLDALADLLERSRATTAPHAAVRSSTLPAVTRLVQAIRAGDADGAEEAMRDHLSALRGVVAPGPRDPWRGGPR